MIRLCTHTGPFGITPRMLRTALVAAVCVGNAAAFSPAGGISHLRSDVRAARSSAVSVRMQETPSGKSIGEGKYDAKRFYVRPDRLGDVVAAAAGFAFNAGYGAFADGYGVAVEKDVEGEYAVLKGAGYMLKETSNVKGYARPAKPIELYEFQGCPFCAKVRYAVACLDLDVTFKPAPRGSTVHRPFVTEQGGKAMFPYMVDPNTGDSMYESADIIKHLYKNYGPGEAPDALLGVPMTFGASLNLLPRLGKGSKKSDNAAPIPAQPLTVWGYEASPFSKVVREALCELELPHVWKSCARGSPKRQELFDKTGGTMQLPFLEDPNSGVSMFESAEIVDYLKETYTAK